jgi:DNA topoisomerase-1
MEAQQRYTRHPLRYTEASLVKKMEELGIGRPSTYAPTISTIQKREYVTKGDVKGEPQNYQIITLKNNKISDKMGKENYGAEKGKLLPTDIGIVVNDYLQANFPEIMDYNFTADVEKEFDDIAEGKAKWTTMIREFYDKFEPMVEKSLNTHTEHKVVERILGTDPKSGMPVSVKIGRFGPVAQIGSSDATEKPRFAQLKKGQTLDSITLDEALELFRLPRTLGEYEGKDITIGAGRFGPYVAWNGMFVSIPKTQDPLVISYDEALEMIQEKQREENERHLKTFSEDTAIEVMNGRFGPYIAFEGKNYRLPKSMHERAAQLTLEECRQIIHEQQEKDPTGKGTAKRRYYARKK